LILFLKKMNVMLKDFEEVDPNKLSNAICLETAQNLSDLWVMVESVGALCHERV
jgi:hypothetical protein